MTSSSPHKNEQQFLIGGGRFGKRISSIDWKKTSLGLPNQWSLALKHTVNIILNSNLPMLIFWGEDFTPIYNDSFDSLADLSKQPETSNFSIIDNFKESWQPLILKFKEAMNGTYINILDFCLELDRNGTIEDCYFDFSCIPIKDEYGINCGILVIGSETTKKVNAIDELNNFRQNINQMIIQSEEKSARLAAIIESSDDAIISKTLESVITSWNNSAQRIFGYTAQEIIGETIYKLIPLDRQDEEPNILNRLKNGERVEHFETKRLTKDGILIDVSLTISPILDQKSNIIGLSKIARDITQQKLEEQRKNDFVPMVSHELKTPLTTISSYVQLLLAKSKKEGDQFRINALSRTEVQTKK